MKFLKAASRGLAGVISATLMMSSVSAEVLTDTQHQTVKTLQKMALKSNLAYQIDESLTTEVGARMVGTEGDKKAIVWAEQKMRQLGFDKVWSEPVDFVPWERGPASASIVSPYPQPMVVIALGGSVGTPAGGLIAEVVGFKTLDDLKNAPKGSLAGKVAFVEYRMERHKNGAGYGKAVGARVSGASIAAEKGAIAILIRSVGTDNHRVGHTGVMRYKDGVKKIPAAALSNPDADMLQRQLDRGQPVTISLDLQAKRLEDQKVTTANVIGEITGSEFPNEYVVMAAHLDSWDVGTGAIDDGLGVSITMAAAHQLLNLPERPKRSIRVILFAGEEVGLIGAKQYVKDHEQDINSISIGSEWDFGIGKIYRMTPGVGPKALVHIEELAQLLAPLGVGLSSENDAKGHSDLSLLGAAGMPAINFHMDGTDYFDFHHTENDTLDKVDQEAMKQATAVYATFAYFAAQSGIDFRR